MKQLKIALVHDYLRDYGGAERVLEALHELYPEAPVYTAFVDGKELGIHWDRFKTWDIHQSWLTNIPLHKQLFSPLRFLAPKLFADFDLSEYDVIISSTNAYFAKAVRPAQGARHICYCHTPARSLYGYTTMTDWQRNPILKFFGSIINHYLRVIDYQVAQKVEVFVANSKETQRRIEKFYRRDSVIVYPPVNVPDQAPDKGERPYFLYVNRLALAKHPELVVQACTELKLPLKVVGTGKMLERLKEMAGPTVEFLGAVSDEQLDELYSGARALLYPAEDEDFGIVPVEAMGHGVPVIAHRSGGPQETIIEGVTGLFMDELNVEALKKAIQQFEKKQFKVGEIYKQAKKFSKEIFSKKIEELVNSKTTPQ